MELGAEQRSRTAVLSELSIHGCLEPARTLGVLNPIIPGVATPGFMMLPLAGLGFVCGDASSPALTRGLRVRRETSMLQAGVTSGSVHVEHSGRSSKRNFADFWTKIDLAY